LSDFKGAIFTPNDEPYLGIEELVAFDELVVAAMKEMERAKPLTKSVNLTTHQKAATLIIPSGVSLCLSVRELVRQAYLHGALTLLRPILERAVTISYLRTHPDSIHIWESGWKYKERPKLHEMTRSLYGKLLDARTNELLRNNNWNVHNLLTMESNDIIHGGIGGLLKNVNFLDSGAISNPGKVVDRPDLARKAALECSTWLSVLVTESSAAFTES
jgi:hypothetical protein